MGIVKVLLSISHLIFCMLGNLCAFFYLLLNFFKIFFFKKKILSDFQTVLIEIRPGILSSLIWVLTVCKGYQQKILADNEK